MITPLKPEVLRRTVDPTQLGMTTTAELPPLEGLIGQERALSALRFGLDIDGFGFNVFASGPPGIGKMTAVRQFLEQLARKRPAPHDWCYRDNFDDHSQPKWLRLPPGRARALQHDLASLVSHIRRELPKAFESESYMLRRAERVRALDRARTELLREVGEHAKAAGFGLQMTPMGVLLLPLREGQPMSEEAYDALSKEERAAFESKREAVGTELRLVMKKVRELERETQDGVDAMDRELASYVVSGLIDDLVEGYKGDDGVETFLHELKNDVLENVSIILSEGPGASAGPGSGAEDDDGEGAQERPAPQARGGPGRSSAARTHGDGFLKRYGLNVLVDSGRNEGAPVVVELNPAYHNVFGRIEKETRAGSVVTDFTMVKPGSLHRANGGYLVLPLEDLLRDPFCWEALKRALRSGAVEIEELADRFGFSSSRTLRPQAVPLDVKVVLVGPPLYFALLFHHDESFRELFKIQAEFDTSMPWTPENERGLLGFVSALCQREGLRPFDPGASARFIEHAARLASDQTRLSTEFGALVDVVRSASYWAGEAGAAAVSAHHVERALRDAEYRANLWEERLREMINRGTLLIDVDGAKVGQVNGLAVLSLGDYAFGRPTRITASVGPGSGGVVDIEREVALSGPIHSKGVLILSGYLRQTFAHDRPLALTAQVVFEQSYEGVEGDSASSTELYALLSALAAVPLRQNVAVTGSVNQRGEVQAIGGVNEKVEGFFAVCKAQGLSGEHGVLIPKANVPHLMLSDEVIEAVRAGRFHVWAVGSVAEGIEVLSGMPAGERDAKGRYPKGSVYGRVEKRLQRFMASLQEPSAAPALFFATTQVGRKKAPSRKKGAPRKRGRPRVGPKGPARKSSSARRPGSPARAKVRKKPRSKPRGKGR